MSDGQLRLAAAALALAGLAIAIYLTVVHYDHSSPVCVGGGGGCEKVQTSDYAELADVPVALIGAIGYAAILVSLRAAGRAQAASWARCSGASASDSASTSPTWSCS